MITNNFYDGSYPNYAAEEAMRPNVSNRSKTSGTARSWMKTAQALFLYSLLIKPVASPFAEFSQSWDNSTLADKNVVNLTPSPVSTYVNSANNLFGRNVENQSALPLSTYVNIENNLFSKDVGLKSAAPLSTYVNNDDDFLRYSLLNTPLSSPASSISTYVNKDHDLAASDKNVLQPQAVCAIDEMEWTNDRSSLIYSVLFSNKVEMTPTQISDEVLNSPAPLTVWKSPFPNLSDYQAERVSKARKDVAQNLSSHVRVTPIANVDVMDEDVSCGVISNRSLTVSIPQEEYEVTTLPEQKSKNQSLEVEAPIAIGNATDLVLPAAKLVAEGLYDVGYYGGYGLYNAAYYGGYAVYNSWYYMGKGLANSVYYVEYGLYKAILTTLTPIVYFQGQSLTCRYIVKAGIFLATDKLQKHFYPDEATVYEVLFGRRRLE